VTGLFNLAFVQRLLGRLARILRYLAEWAEHAATQTSGQQLDVNQFSPPADWLERVRKGAPQLIFPDALAGVPQRQTPVVRRNDAPFLDPQRDSVADPRAAHGVELATVPEQHTATKTRSASATTLPPISSAVLRAEVARSPRRTIAMVEEFALPLRETPPGQVVNKFEDPGVLRTEPASAQAEPPRRPGVSTDKSSRPALRPIPPPARSTEPLSSHLESPVRSEGFIQTNVAPEAVISAVWPDLTPETAPLPPPDRRPSVQSLTRLHSHPPMPSNSSQVRSYPAFAPGGPSGARPFSEHSEPDETQPVPSFAPSENTWPELADDPAQTQLNWEDLLQRYRREAALLAEQRGEIQLWNG
jgi:hypothetical protein